MSSDRPVMLVTGGSGSIGAVIAEQALRAGWAVALHGRTDVSISAAVNRISASLSNAAALKGFAADITASGQVEKLVADVGAWRDRIDAVVDCVSNGPKNRRLTGLFAETEPEGYGEFLDMSVGHLQRLAHASLPWLKKQGGTIVAFASDAGKFAAPRQSLVGASRAGIMGFVRNLAMETARDGVRVHCVSPSFVDETGSAVRMAAMNGDRVEAARKKAGLGLPTPADIAPVVLFLCGDGARKITGQIISINGGVNA